MNTNFHNFLRHGFTLVNTGLFFWQKKRVCCQPDVPPDGWRTGLGKGCSQSELLRQLLAVVHKANNDGLIF